MFKEKCYRKRGCRQISIAEWCTKSCFWSFQATGLFILSRGLWHTAHFSMKNISGIIIIQITHSNGTEASQRIFSGHQKGRYSVSPTFCHHRAPHSITSAGWHPRQWHGSPDSQGLSDNWESAVVCPYWCLLQETHAYKEEKTSLPWHALCRQAWGFQRMAHFMVLRKASTPSPLGTSNFKQTGDVSSPPASQ